MVVSGVKPPTDIGSVFDLALIEKLPLGMFRLFAGVKRSNRTVITHDPRPDFAAGSFFVFKLGV